MNSTRLSSDTIPSFQATLVNAGYGQLVLRDAVGKVSQKWTLAQPKCILGTAENCTIRCSLPGITDHHLMLIIGAKQLFLRSMAPGLSVSGRALSELVIGSDPHIASQREIEFELAGHRFQYLRTPIKTPLNKADDSREDVAQLVESPIAVRGAEQSPPINESLSPSRKSAGSAMQHSTRESMKNEPQSTERMRFTFVRALEKSRNNPQADQGNLDGAVASKPMWVEEIVRDALRPVESQLEGITGPLRNLQRQMQQAERRQRKIKQARKLRKSSREPVQPPPPNRELLESQEAIQRIVADQAERLAEVNRHVGAIMSQIATIERNIAQESDQHQTIVNTTNRSGEEIMRLQREMMQLVTQLQTQVAQPESTRDDELLWRASVEKQLEELHASLAILNEIKLDLHQAIDQSRELSQEWEQHWQTIEEVARRPVVIQQPPVIQPAQPYPFQSQDEPAPVNYSIDNSVTPYVSPTISFDTSSPTLPQPSVEEAFPSGLDSYHVAALQYEPDIRDDEGLNDPVPPQTESVVNRVAASEPVQLPDWWKEDPVTDSPSRASMQNDQLQPTSESRSISHGLENYFSSKYFPTAEHATGQHDLVNDAATADTPQSAADDYAMSAFSDEHLSIAQPQSHQDQPHAEQSPYPPAYGSQDYQQPYGQPSFEPSSENQLAYDQPAYNQQVPDQQAYNPQAYDQQAYDQQAYNPQAYGQQAYDQAAQHEENPYIRPSFGQLSDAAQVDQSESLQPEARMNDQAGHVYGEDYDARLQPEENPESYEDSYAHLSAEDLIDDLSAEATDEVDSYQREIPTAYGQTGAATDYNTQSLRSNVPEHSTRPFLAQEQPTVSAASSGNRQSHSSDDDGGDESVEDYMRRLLARMRGVSESEVTLPGLDTSAQAAKEPSAIANQSADRSAAGAQDAEPLSEAWTEPFDPEKYVPRGAAPEKNRDLNALRELANTSARSAIQVSARRRQGSAVLIKSTVALVGLIAGFAIISINGAQINIAFVAMIASFLVAVIWGYDTLSSVRPLLQELRSPKTKEPTPTE